MVALLLLSVFLSVCFIAAIQYKGKPVICSREVFIAALLLNAFLCWLYAEGASLFHAIHNYTALIFWSCVVLVQSLLCFRICKKHGLRFRDFKSGIKVESWSRSEKSVVVFVVLGILLPLLILAIVVPPNNYDSHYYHLHRILAWTQNGNLDFFPTQHIQQLYHNVFAEYIILNVYLLTGSDQFINLVQYLAGIGTIMAITLLARQLGMNRRGQFLTAVILVTLPIGIFEMTSTQVDYIATFFFVSFLYFGYKLLSAYHPVTVICMAASLSFAAFTKYPALFYALPFCIYFGIQFLIRYKIKRSVRILSCILLCFVFIFTPFWQRNYSLFGHVLSPKESSVFFAEKLPAEKFGFKYTLSGFIKNSSLHFGLPFSAINTQLEEQIGHLHHLINVGINEPGLYQDPFMVRYSVHEDTVPNTLHFYCIAILSLFLLFKKENSRNGGSRNGDSRLKVFWLLAVIGFMIFSSMLKFQLWSTRTHLPFLAMGSILIAFSIQSFSRFFQTSIILVFLISSQFYVLGNPSKPILPVPYYGKILTGHLPVSLCIPAPFHLEDYRAVSDQYYDFTTSDGFGCYPIKGSPDYGERVKINTAIDNLGYYDAIKKTIFDIPRHEAYFMSQKGRFLNYSPFFRHITEEHPHIGLITGKADGAYFYQVSLKAATGITARIDYIYFRKEFSTLRNYQKPFCYSYILSDDTELAKELIPENQIDQLYQTEQLALIRLKTPMCNKYEY